MSRLLADVNISRKCLAACRRLQPDFPIMHIADWMGGEYLHSEDPLILQTAREKGFVVASFDRSTMAMHAGDLTRKGLGHAGVILFRRSVGQTDYGKQARLLIEFWRGAAEWDWTDRIAYLP